MKKLQLLLIITMLIIPCLSKGQAAKKQRAPKQSVSQKKKAPIQKVDFFLLSPSAQQIYNQQVDTAAQSLTKNLNALKGPITKRWTKPAPPAQLLGILKKVDATKKSAQDLIQVLDALEEQINEDIKNQISNAILPISALANTGP
jgi:hypothetical protein